MRPLFPLFLLPLLLAFGCTTGPALPGSVVTPKTAALFVVAGFDDQVTGVAVSRQGRVFVNFPRWSRDPKLSVTEVLPDGALRPYPDTEWNRWDRYAVDPASAFVCVQSVYADAEGYLWILDPASPSFKGVVPGGAKLVKVNLATDKVERIYRFDEKSAPKRSYLNDVRVSPDGNFAYLTDSGLGALVVLDLKSGASRRLLERHRSTHGEPGLVPVVDGKELRDVQGNPPQIHADGIALDSGGEYLYYHALTARTLFRIRTSCLQNGDLSEPELEGCVEKVAETGPMDGMEMGSSDILYYTALEENAVRYLRPSDRKTGLVAKDDQLQWPDSLSIGPDDYLYITSSQINRMPRFNDGTDRHIPPYRLFRIWLAPL